MNIDYQVIRSNKRKTIALQIKNNQVIVRAPTGISREYIHTLISNKSQWIENKLAVYRQHIASPSPSYLPDSKILINGIEKKIAVEFIKIKNDTRVIDSVDKITITLPLSVTNKLSDHNYLSTQIKKQLAIWLKTQAESYLQIRLEQLTNQLRITPASYRVKRYKARWGSCNNKHELSFNYLLIMAPSWVFDYVIVHELCHIKHLNHSTKFWSLVEKHMPHYKDAENWLKQHQAQMHWS